MQANLTTGRLERVEVEYRGSDVAPHVKPLTVALLRGLLVPTLGAERVNYVNAPIIAQERGIVVSQALDITSANYTNLISCRVSTDEETHTIAGVLFNGRQPRIVQIDGFVMDAVPEGLMLVVSSRDVPGVIGRIGTDPGPATTSTSPSIAWAAPARATSAMSFINLDNPVPEEAMQTLARSARSGHRPADGAVMP